MTGQKKALVLVADGFEEAEAVISIDILRRAGVHTVIGLVGGTGRLATGNQDIKISIDDPLEKAIASGPYNAVVLPGGMAACKTLAANEHVKKLLEEHYKEHKIIAAIGAAPVFVLPAAKVGEGHKVTCHPTLGSHFDDKYTYEAEQKVVVDHNLITSQAIGTAFDFALHIVEAIISADRAKEIKKTLLL